MYYEPLTPNILKDSLNYLNNNTLGAPIKLPQENINQAINNLSNIYDVPESEIVDFLKDLWYNHQVQTQNKIVDTQK